MVIHRILRSVRRWRSIGILQIVLLLLTWVPAHRTALAATVGSNQLVTENPDPFKGPTGEERKILNVQVVNGHFVAFSLWNTFYTSEDGATWSARLLAPQRREQATAMTFGKGQYIAVGIRIYRSRDLRTWETDYSLQMKYLRDVVFFGNQFVAVGIEGQIFVSSDGVDWESVQSGTTQDLSKIVAGADRLLVITRDNKLLQSSDGRTWSEAAFPMDRIADLIYANGQFVAVGSQRVAFSANGTSWKEYMLPDTGMWSIAYGDGRFVGVGRRKSYTSSDGLTWQGTSNFKVSNDWEVPIGVGYSNGHFVTHIFTHVNPEFYTSTDGVVWNRGTVVAQVPPPGDPLPPPNPSCGSVFKDVPADSPACRAIERLATDKVISGPGDGTFRPGNTLTRAEFAKMLVVAMKWPPDPQGPTSFHDVKGHWATNLGYLQAAVARQIFSGLPDGSFQPDGQVTRSQLIKVVVAAAKITPAKGPSYGDVRQDQWFNEWIAVALQNRIIGANARTPLWTDANLNPEQPATRAEAALILTNLLDR